MIKRRKWNYKLYDYVIYAFVGEKINTLNQLTSESIKNLKKGDIIGDLIVRSINHNTKIMLIENVK